MDDETPKPTLVFHEVPTVLVDAGMAYAHANGILRLVLGEHVFDTTPDAKAPRLRSALNLAIPIVAVPALIEFLQEALPEAQGDKGE